MLWLEGINAGKSRVLDDDGNNLGVITHVQMQARLMEASTISIEIMVDNSEAFNALWKMMQEGL